MRVLWSLLAVGLLLTVAGLAAPTIEEQLPPKPVKYVTDRAGILGGERFDALSRKLEQFERDTSNQVLVWIDRKIPENFTLEDFTVRAAEKWGAGQAKTDNGAVLFVFVDDRKLRIEVGYGLEGVLPDITAKRIIEEEIVPRFRANDYSGGVEAGVDAMIAATRGEYKGTGSTVAERSKPVVSSRTWLEGCIVPMLFFGLFLGLPLYLRTKRRWRTFGGSGWWTGGGWGGFGGGGGGWSGGGGGGFSGGGGSFGGGGASGSW